MKKYCSNARWPDGTLDGWLSDETQDYHFSEAEARGVCRMLENEGFGGEGKIFPIETWVSLREE